MRVNDCMRDVLDYYFWFRKCPDNHNVKYYDLKNGNQLALCNSCGNQVEIDSKTKEVVQGSKFNMVI